MILSKIICDKCMMQVAEDYWHPKNSSFNKKVMEIRLSNIKESLEKQWYIEGKVRCYHEDLSGGVLYPNSAIPSKCIHKLEHALAATSKGGDHAE